MCCERERLSVCACARVCVCGGGLCVCVRENVCGGGEGG